MDAGSKLEAPMAIVMVTHSKRAQQIIILFFLQNKFYKIL